MLGRVLSELTVPTRTRVLVTGVALLALVAGLGGVVFALQRSEGTATHTRSTVIDVPGVDLPNDGVGSPDVVSEEAARQAVTVDELHVGDCVNDLLYPDAVVVPCNAAHQGEIVAVLVAPKGPYPGQELLVDTFAAKCEAEGADYVRNDPTLKDDLYFAPEIPDAADWDARGRAIICAAFPVVQEPLEKSVRASGG
jgi:hypothetical protein